MSSTLALSAMLSKLGATPADEAKVNHDPSGAGAGADAIRIAPVLVDSKCGGALQTIVGVALIVVAGMPGGPRAAANVAKFWGAVGAAGWSLAIGGVAQMLSAQPRGLGDEGEPREHAELQHERGRVRQALANPVPVAYGATTRRGMVVGSVVISSGIYAEDHQ